MAKKTVSKTKPAAKRKCSCCAGTAATETKDRGTLLKCPKCSSAMQPVVFKDIEVDRCVGCQGLWFDLLEQEDLKKLEGSEAVDFGEAKKGREMNKVDRIECPVCHEFMVRMVDPKQPHIWFESCGKCYGVFFDAGEFRDWKKHNAFDWLKRLLAKDRR